MRFIDYAIIQNIIKDYTELRKIIIHIANILKKLILANNKKIKNYFLLINGIVKMVTVLTFI